MKKFCRKGHLKRSGKRWLALLMSVCLIGTMIPITARAENGSTETGLCEHHTEHTPECGYVAPARGHECEHVHDESCGYQEASECNHVHTEECGENGENCTHVHTSECGYAEGHACEHVHTSECGYVEASEGSPCTYVCDICGEEGKQGENIVSDENLTKQATDKHITTWQWIDEEEYLDPETGSLTLPGASEEMPAYFDDVTAFLPTQILATVVNADDSENPETGVEKTITLGDWSCDNFPEEGAYSGSYTFTATLPEGYSLPEEAEALTVLVELGGAQQWNVTGVSYRSCDENGTNWTTETCTSATEVKSEDTAWGTSATDTWYVVNGTMTIGTLSSKVRISVSGNVNLILTDGCSLTINGGIEVADGNSLTIYGQTDDTGSLLIKNVERQNAGIGSASSTKCGSITINGGNVNVASGSNGAGIGSGNQGNSGIITINGGTVTATGNGYSAGIGGGERGAGGTITINGGTVTATGGNSGGAGIGGGEWGAGGTITINGGTVTATGGSYGGAGIGGGGYAAGGNITINGGTVTATGGTKSGAGIGGGGKITISGGTVTATGGTNGGAGIGDGINGSGGTVAISNSFVMAGSISDTSRQDSWSGLIFEGDTGKVYGDSFTISTDCTIPSGKSLVVAAEQTISIAETATFTNEGNIYNSGTFNGAIENSGTIHNTGTISGASGGTINQYSIAIEQTETSCQSAALTLKVNDTAFGESVTYTLSDDEANAVIENVNTLKVADSGVGTQIPVTATFTVDGVPMTRTESVTITSGHDYNSNGFCTICNGYQPATKNTEDCYEIGNAGQLYWFADKVNNDNSNFGSAKAVLTKDILVNKNVLVNGELNTSENGSFRSWTPIGNDVNLYTGTFDGQGYTVSGLYVNDVDNVGLFGFIQSDGCIKNVGVVDSYFNGNKSVGGVCGLNKNGTIENCYNKSYVSGTEYIGGVCGYNYAHELGTATIKNCHNEGKVSGSDYVGGVCGFNNDDPEGVATIEYCYNTGEVSSTYHVGGVCGWNRSVHGLSEIKNCYNVGKVSGTNYIGGVCGCNYSSGGISDIRKCFNTGKVSGTGDAIGGVCGLNSQESGASATVTNCYYLAGCNAESTSFTCEEGTSKTATWFASGEATYLLNGSSSEKPVWYQNIDLDGETADAYPVLDSNHGTVYYGYDDDACQTPKYSNSRLNAEPIHDYTNNNGFCIRCDAYEPATLTTDKYDIDGDGDKDEVYEIGNAGQLYWFAALVNGTDGLTQNLGANAVLTADITVNTGDVANCGGTKQAGWKDWTPIVGNSYPNYYAGTFDGQNHTVSGLYFNDSDVNNVGLFGATGSSGKISKVGVVDSYFCGKDRVGGVCGVKYGTMENCYSASTVSGANAVGGVCGDNCGSSQLINCYNTGAVNCSVSGGWYIGGVCGILNSGTIQNCYSTGTVGGSSTSVGGVCGQTQGTSANISNCYFDSSKCDKNAVGVTNNGTVEKTESKTTEQFASGEVAYLLNGEKSEGTAESPLAWYQNIDRDSETADTYPVLDSNHGTVYQCTNCTGVYSNTQNKSAAHSFKLDENDSTKHTCEKCGTTEAHSTTNFSYSTDVETNRITVYCNEGGCDANIGYAELAAPSGTITYDGTAKTATVSDTVDGVDFSATPITYKQGGTTLTSAPKDAGSYTASITLGTGESAATVSVEYTIDKATPTISWGMFSGSTWVEMTSMPVNYTGSEIAPNKLLVQPTVTLVNGETYSGEISYSYRVQGSSDAFTSGLPTDIGAYEVKASIAADGNYKEAAGTVTLTVNWFSTAEAATLTGQGGSSLSGDNWWAQSVTFTAPNGFTISNNVDGTYGTSFVYDTQTGADETEVTYYLKNSNGEIAQKAATVRVDRTAPTWPENGGITIKNNRWKEFLNTISFGLFFKETLEVKASAADSLSGVAAYYYYVDETGSTTVLSSDVLDTETFTKVEGSGEHTLTSLGSEGSYVVYAYAVDAVGNKSDYVCTNGVVLDTTAPTIRDITTPSKEALTLTDTSAKISFTGSEAGTCFYMVKKSSETAPASITDFATEQTNDGFSTWTAKQDVSYAAMTADGSNTVILTGLNANTEYTLYLAAVDQAGNSIQTIASRTFTTCKTMPTVAAADMPKISGTYGQTVENMTLTPGTAKVGSTVITGAWTVTDSGKTDTPSVGTTNTYQVTFTPDNGMYDTVNVQVTPTVAQKVVTVTAENKTKTYGKNNPDLTFTVPEGALVGTDTEDDLGVTLSCEATAVSPVKEGGYAITGTSSSANYNVTVTPGTLTIEKADATITVGTTSYDKTFGDADFTLDVTDTNSEANVQYEVTTGTDVITVSNGTVTILKAGTATITVSLPASTNYNAADTKTITVTVAKKSGYTVADINRSYLYSRDNADTIDLSGYLPANCGKVTYGNPQTSGTVEYTVSPAVADGKLSYTVKLADSAGATGTITVQVTTDNYANFTITVDVKLIDQIPVSLKSGSSVTLQNSTLTYGQALSTLTFNSAVFVDDGGNVVTGTLAWKTPDEKPNAGTTSATWVFTPNDESYATLEDTVAITVNKATPQVTNLPTVAARTYNPTVSLTNDDLTGGTVNVSGSWSWQTANIIPTVNNNGYVAVFTPTDSTNYETVTKTITVTVTKATPYIATVPTADAITYGDTLGASTLSGGTVQYSSSDATTVAGSFAWKDSSVKPSVSDSNSMGYRVVFTPSDADNYNTVETDITLIVNKAGNAPNMPSSTMNVANSCEKVSDVTLPTGWVWQDADKNTELTVGTAVTATAEYNGADKGNYENETVSVSITRSACDHAHTEVRNAKEATCKETGYTGDTYCKDCGALLTTGTTIPFADHQGGTATCTKKAVCTVCGQEYGELDANNHVHTEIRGAVAATCTAGGYTGDTYCTDCGVKIKTGTATPALGHNYTSKVTTEPTTDREGVRTYTCDRCGHSYTESIPKLPEEEHQHSYSDSVTKEPTCTDTGVRTYTCSCGDSYTETIPALGHHYVSSVTKQPTTSSEGVMTYTCDRCGHSYTRAIAKLQDNNNNNPTDNNPGENQPGENQPGGENTPDIGKPYIKYENGKEGWDVIKDEVDKTKAGDTVTVEMNGSAVVPGNVLDEIKGEDVTIVFDMGNGITWSVNGQNITSDKIGDIDFSVTIGTTTIPTDVINNVTGERYSQQISLAYDGEFGFTAVLSINMEASNAGMYANLFYFNEKIGELEFICADEIAADGTAELTFIHASDYAIVIDKESMEGSVQIDSPASESQDTETESTQTGAEVSNDAWNPWWIIVIGIMVIVIGLGVFLVAKKNKSDDE